MKKKLAFVIGAILMNTFFAYSQFNEPLNESKSMSITTRAFKATLPTADKSDNIEITGYKLASISVSNMADGSQSSYKHSLRIVLNLTLANSKTGPAQLVFYSSNENVPYAEYTEAGVLTAYYPVEVYDNIRQQLDESFTAKRKVQFKITEKTTGYREAMLVF